MNNQITIDLSGIKDKGHVLSKLGEVFEFGGPNGNIPVSSDSRKGWGLNWDALGNSLQYLATGGIWGASKKFVFPLKVIFENSRELQENENESLEILKQIFDEVIKNYSLTGRELIVEFK